MPIKSNKYLALYMSDNAADLCPKRHKSIAETSNKLPWPISPNIVPNKNGNVTVVKIAGLTSL